MRVTWVVAALAAAGAMTISGCGSDDGGTAAPATGGAKTTAAAPAGAASTAAAAAAEDVDVCAALPAAVMGKAVGATLTAKPVPGGGCSYDDDVYGIQVTRIEDPGGGIESYLSGLKGSLRKPTVREVTGVGDRATVLAGTSSYGSTLGGGVAQLGTALVTTTVLQRGASPAAIAETAEKSLRAAVAELG